MNERLSMFIHRMENHKHLILPVSSDRMKFRTKVDPESKSTNRCASAEKEYFSQIRGFLTICQYFGSAPYHSIPDGKSIPWTSFKQFCHLIWCFILLNAILVATWFQYGGFDSFHTTFLLKILYFGEYLSGILNSILIICGSYYRRKTYSLFINRVWQIFSIITKMDEKIDFTHVKKLWQRCCAVYAIFFIIILIVDFMYNNQNIIWFLRSSTVYSLSNMIGVLALTQYMILLYLIRLAYSRVRKMLANTKQTYFNQWWHRQTIPFPLKEYPTPVTIADDTCELTMERLRLICLDLCEFHRDVNNVFGPMLINTILATFIILNTQFYTFYRIFEHIHDQSKDTCWITIYTMLWIVLHSGKMLMILIWNHLIYETKSTISTQIYRVRCESTSNHVNELESYYKSDVRRGFSVFLCHFQVYRFALQALNESERDYTYGILRLDLSLLAPVSHTIVFIIFYFSRELITGIFKTFRLSVP